MEEFKDNFKSEKVLNAGSKEEKEILDVLIKPYSKMRQRQIETYSSINRTKYPEMQR